MSIAFMLGLQFVFSWTFPTDLSCLHYIAKTCLLLLVDVSLFIYFIYYYFLYLGVSVWEYLVTDLLYVVATDFHQSGLKTTQ